MALDGAVEPPLWRHFDKIKSALYKQQQQQRFGRIAYGTWLVKAMPYWVDHVDVVYDAAEQNYGDTLCAWLDWADKRGLAWRGQMKDHFQTLLDADAPLRFVPPSSAGLMVKAGQLVTELGLADSIRRSARYGVAPIEGTRGGSGRKGRSQFTVRKPSG